MKLQKMLLVNWLYYEKTLLHFDDIVFLSGKTGEGKSALIDAMQVLLLGRCDNAIFNKSANDKTTRDLMGYLVGKYKNGTCKREKGMFSSHLCMQFVDEKQDVYSFGIVFDVAGKTRADMNYHFYMMNQPIPEHGFVEDHEVYSIRKLKKYLDQFQHRGCRMFTTNTDYRNYFCQRMMIKDQRFFDVFKMAVAYTPMMNISQFIVKNICQEEEDLDLEEMQEEMKDYQQMKEQLETVQMKKEQLAGIHEQYIDICREQEEQENLKVEKEAAAYYEIVLEKQQKQACYQKHIEQSQVLHQDILAYEAKRKEVEEGIEQVKKALDENASHKLAQAIKQVEDAIAKLHLDITHIQKQMQEKGRRMEHYLDQLEDLDDGTIEEFDWDLSHLRLLIKQAQNQAQDLAQFDCEAYSILQKELQQLDTVITNCMGKYGVQVEALKNKREELKQQRMELEAGRKNYPRKLCKLKEELQSRLSALHHKPVSVEILADLIQIKDPKWTQAIEGYIHNQKFNLIVEEPYFMDAYRIYRSIKEEYQLHTYSIVDIAKAKARKQEGVNTLYDCVAIEREDIKEYVAYLLGRVVCCEEEATLRDYPVSITSDCMLYSGYAVSHMNPKWYEQPFIGKDSIEQQRKALIQLQQQTERMYHLSHNIYHTLQGMSFQALLNDDFLHQVKESVQKAKQEKELQEELVKLQEQETPETLTEKLRLQEELLAYQQTKQRYEQKEIDCRAQQKMLEKEQWELNESLQELQERLHLYEQQEPIIIPATMRAIQEVETLRRHKKKIEQAYEQLKNSIVLQQEQLINKKLQYNTTFHIHLNTDFQQDDYEREYEKHSANAVEAYIAKCDLAQQKAYECFQNNFFSAINSKIENVKMQIDRLNRSIRKHRFGRSRYEFVCTCNEDYREYYNLITNKELNGRNLLNTKAYEENEELIKELFDKISSLSITMDHKKYEALEKEVRMLSRFTTYLKFDILENGNSLRATIGSSSGGETQTPFYVAVLVSLFSVYDKANDGLQLAVFDEAFDKMDNERIEECIALLKSLGFQAIIVTPTDKISNLSKLADATLIATSDERNGQRISTIQRWSQQVNA